LARARRSLDRVADGISKARTAAASIVSSVA
jgi:hypothetical protein